VTKTVNFVKSRWQTAATLKIVISPYIIAKSYISKQGSRFEANDSQITKNVIFSIQDSRWPPY